MQKVKLILKKIHPDYYRYLVALIAIYLAASLGPEQTFLMSQWRVHWLWVFAVTVMLVAAHYIFRHDPRIRRRLKSIKDPFEAVRAELEIPLRFCLYDGQGTELIDVTLHDPLTWDDLLDDLMDYEGRKDVSIFLIRGDLEVELGGVIEPDRSSDPEDNDLEEEPAADED